VINGEKNNEYVEVWFVFESTTVESKNPLLSDFNGYIGNLTSSGFSPFLGIALTAKDLNVELSILIASQLTD
jgi:hypothetical protein